MTGREVASRLVVEQVAVNVGGAGFDDREVCTQAPLHHVLLAFKFAEFLALGERGTDGSRGVERWDARAARSECVRRASLRNEFEFDLAASIEFGKNG